ncbi:MAG: MBL fold metallo-hydrolase [Aquificaceae bacterium]|nr:MAG: MBL fold metallo-hydrolase [Aquificaceae bacterium]
MMLLKQLFDTETSTFTYLLVDAASRDAVIIDPVYGQMQRDLDALKELNAELKYIVETHVHADHITGAYDLKQATNAKFAAGVGTGLTCGDALLAEGEVIHFGHEVLHAIPTPGHTDGCTSYRWRDRLFTGDTLLINACGRTDFQQGSPENLYNSIQKLLTFSDDYIVYPGHDYNGLRISSIGQEKQNNPYIVNTSKEEFIEKMNNLNLPKPKKIDESVPANLRCGNARIAA